MRIETTGTWNRPSCCKHSHPTMVPRGWALVLHALVSVEANLECGLWVAPSTIPGAGLGLYAGIDYQPDDELVPGGDSVVAITDYTSHTAYNAPDPHFLWDDYTWGPEGVKMYQEGYQHVSVASEGFGSVANSFLPLVNVHQWPSVRHMGTGLHRARDPGAGASTLFHYRKSTANREIAAGTELFVSYGEDWFTARTSALGPIPLTNDLNRATLLLRKYTTLQQALLRRGFSLDVATSLWRTFVQQTKFTESRVLRGAFYHDTPNDLVTLQTEYQGNVTRARLAQSQRSIDWLREHGTCGDHMVAAPSTLPQAGMGALARRALVTGTIVAHLPMIHIPRRRRFELFTLSPNDQGDWLPVNDTVIGHQLLLNYCYGHNESTLLLCPYGPMTNYINHNQTMANVKLQWAPRASPNRMPHEWNETIDTLERSHRATLALELVATRDIAEGDEIWLDYGDEWEAAWHAHVSTWRPVDGAVTHTAAVHWDMDPTVRLHTVFDELVETTYTNSTVDVVCDVTCQTHPDEVKEHYRAGTLDDYLWETNAAWLPCSILQARLDENGTDGDYLYTIHLHGREDGAPGTLIPNVPRRIIHFMDRPGTSDMFLPNAFRHDIRIPDDIFPMAWRNLR